MGVVPYLTDDGFAATLRFLSSCAKGSVLVFDYGLPRHALPPLEQLALDSMSARVAAAGEPFRLFFLPAEIHHRLVESGWELLHDLDRDAMNARYFSRGNLHVLGSGGHLLAARLV
jgi:O-methyltransferase involved in polyketide biosynthesis